MNQVIYLNFTIPSLPPPSL